MMRKYFLKHVNSAIAMIMLLTFIASLSACSGKKNESHTYEVNSGDAVTVCLDTTGGYTLKNDYGDFLVLNGREDTIIHGTFRPEEEFNELHTSVKKDPEYSIINETAESFTYVVFGKSGWETNRIIRLGDAQTTVIMESIYEDSKAVLKLYEQVTFLINEDIEQESLFDKEIMGVTMKAIIVVLAVIVVVALVVVIILLKRESMRFRKYYRPGDGRDDSRLLHDKKRGGEDDGDDQTGRMFGNDGRDTVLKPHVRLVLRDIDDGNELYRVDLDKPKKIGRPSQKKDVDIVIPGDKNISREHCCVRADKDDIYIRDLESMNGTRVNGKEIDKETRLKNGDRLKIGKHVFIIEVKKDG